MALTITELPREQYASPTEEIANNGVSPFVEQARDAVRRLFDWADDSPGANQWLKAHVPALEIDVATRLNDLTYEHLGYDALELYVLFDPEKDRPTQTSNPKMFHAMDIAYAGIRDIVERSRIYPPQGDLELAERTQADIIQAVGAQIVRWYYLERVAEQHGDILTPERLASFGHLYQQNITSDIQRAALIEKNTARAEQSTMPRAAEPLTSNQR